MSVVFRLLHSLLALFRGFVDRVCPGPVPPWVMFRSQLFVNLPFSLLNLDHQHHVHMHDTCVYIYIYYIHARAALSRFLSNRKIGEFQFGPLPQKQGWVAFFASVQTVQTK